MDPWLYFGFLGAFCWQQWQIETIKGRLGIHRDILRQIVDAVNGDADGEQANDTPGVQ